MKIIILAGGSGTRLWPLSRGRRPKQFIEFRKGMPSLFQQTLLRSLLLAGLGDIYVVTQEKYRLFIDDAVEELGYERGVVNIVIEPEAKSTLPAIYAGVAEIRKSGDDIVAVFPSDHLLASEEDFARNVRASAALASQALITFGIKPGWPCTGYGYIAAGQPLFNGFKVSSFREKPCREDAARFVEAGWFWNAGIFMFDTALFVQEVKKHAGDIHAAFERASCLEEAFGSLGRSVSIDYGLLEKSGKVAVVPVEVDWTDLGSFDSVYEALAKDAALNVADESSLLIDSSRNYVYTDKGKLVAAIGVSDLVIVDSRDVLLVSAKEQAHKLKELVEQLKKKQDPRTEYYVQDYRPWGRYLVLEEEKGFFKIKKIIVNPRQELSYQLHRHRSEHWVVVKGTARVKVEGAEKLVPTGESVFIKPGEKHRLANEGNEPLEIIEVQLGDYLEEDDVIRFDDDYGRI